jgi:hypothetical protein
VRSLCLHTAAVASAWVRLAVSGGSDDAARASTTPAEAQDLAVRAKTVLESVESLAVATSSASGARPMEPTTSAWTSFSSSDAIYTRAIAPFARFHARIGSADGVKEVNGNGNGMDQDNKVDEDDDPSMFTSGDAHQLARDVARKGYLGVLLEWAAARK